jgi:hypothetical protein
MPKISRGWITYRDIFGKTHRQGFTYLVHKSGRTDPLPDSFEYQPWNMKYKEIPSKQEPLPPDFKTVQIKNRKRLKASAHPLYGLSAVFRAPQLAAGASEPGAGYLPTPAKRVRQRFFRFVPHK